MVYLSKSAWQMLTRQAMYSYVILRRVRVTIVAVEKAINIAYSQCVSLALVIRHAKCMLHIAICGLSGSTKNFPHCHKRHHFREKKILNVKCVLIFCTTFV
jgi:hypothetical protein